MSRDLEIVLYPDPILRRPTERVAEITDEIREIVPAMQAVMERLRGLGLAANQVGIPLRMALISDTGAAEDTRVVLNPEVIEQDGGIAIEEGCLSFPGLTGLITRPERIKVRYTNLDGETVEEEADGLLARCYLHEIDHLDGILFISKMTPADRLRLKRPLKEMESEYASGQAARR